MWLWALFGIGVALLPRRFEFERRTAGLTP